MTAITKRIAYSRDDRDYAAYISIDGGPEEVIGSRPTFHDADLLADDYILNFYQDAHTPENAAELIMQQVEEEGRHEQEARDMGREWNMDEAVAITMRQVPGKAPHVHVNGGAYARERAAAAARCSTCGDEGGCPDCEALTPTETDEAIVRSMLRRRGLCVNCAGAHPTWRCPEIGMLLMPGPLPASDPQNDVCWSCGDQLSEPTHGPALCGACREAGEPNPAPPVDDGPEDNFGGFRNVLPYPLAWSF